MQYLVGISALKFWPFRMHGTRSRQFVYFEQLATVQLGEIDIFVNLDPKMRHQGYIIVLLTQIAEYSPGTTPFCFSVTWAQFTLAYKMSGS